MALVPLATLGARALPPLPQRPPRTLLPTFWHPCPPEGQPLPEALQSLLAKQNHLIVYAGSENPEAQGKIAKIILMRPASETRPGATRGRGASPLAGPDAKPASRETRDAPAARGASSPTETLTGDPGELANPQDFLSKTLCLDLPAPAAVHLLRGITRRRPAA